MIPTEVAEIATLIWEDWADLPDSDAEEIIAAAFRIYNSGFRRAALTEETGGERQ